MDIMGLQTIYKGPNTSKKHPQHRIYSYLLRKLAITRPNQVWCSDITYIPVKRGFLYLVAIMDCATRKVLSWRLSPRFDDEFCLCCPHRSAGSRVPEVAVPTDLLCGPSLGPAGSAIVVQRAVLCLPAAQTTPVGPSSCNYGT
jgi:transposase InsO family protein